MSEQLSLQLTALPEIPLIKVGDDLNRILLKAIDKTGLALEDGDVLVVAQKIVSKGEGCFADLSSIVPSERAYELAEKTNKDPRLVEVILSESTEVVRHAPNVLIVAHRLGFVSANAGIDRSNVDSEPNSDQVLLLPKDPDRSCALLRQKLESATGKHIGVIINDSHSRAWRVGSVGLALGVSGVPGVIDMRGRADLFDRTLLGTEIGSADEISAAASILMGQANEGRPAVLVRGLPYTLREGNAQELIRPKNKDLFR